jgi:hypothetical protein
MKSQTLSDSKESIAPSNSEHLHKQIEKLLRSSCIHCKMKERDRKRKRERERKRERKRKRKRKKEKDREMY